MYNIYFNIIYKYLYIYIFILFFAFFPHRSTPTLCFLFPYCKVQNAKGVRAEHQAPLECYAERRCISATAKLQRSLEL